MKRSDITKAFTTAAAAVFVISSLTGCGSTAPTSTAETFSAPPAESTAGGDNSLRTIRVGIATGVPDQYAVYIGTENGIFEKYGINVETTEYAAGINTVDAIVNGTEDTGFVADYAYVNRIGNTLEHTDLTLFAEFITSTAKAGGIYVAPQYADDLSALDGSEGWAAFLGTVEEYYVWQAQTYLGLDPAKQKLVPIDSASTAIAVASRGDSSAVVATGSLAHKYEEIGWKQIASADDFGYGSSFYLLTNKAYLSQNSDLLADYLQALEESIAIINNDLDGTAEKVSAKFGISPEDFKLNWSQYNFAIGVTEEGAQHLEFIADWAYEHEKYPEKYDIRDYISSDAVEKAFPDRVTIKK